MSRRCTCSTPPAVPGSEAEAGTKPAGQRMDPCLGTVVHVVGDRQARPNLPSPGCPFCVGGLEAPDPYEVHWFPNRWPAMQGGRCEVVLYTPDHDATLPSLGVQGGGWRAARALGGGGTTALGQRGDVEFVLVFENRGAEVGATIAHPHGQIYAYDHVPPEASIALERSGALCAGPGAGGTVV